MEDFQDRPIGSFGSKMTSNSTIIERESFDVEESTSDPKSSLLSTFRESRDFALGRSIHADWYSWVNILHRALDSLNGLNTISRRALVAISVSIFAIFLVVFVATRFTHQQSSPLPIGPHWPGFENLENWFAFGDSWTTRGFNVRGRQPSAEHPTGNRDNSDSPNPNYVNFLTTRYNQSVLKTYNFAFAGSVVDTHNDLALFDWLDFPHQLKDEFLAYYVKNDSGNLSPLDWNSSNSLFSMFFGINDVIVMDRQKPHLDKTAQSYERLIDELYAASARNFMIINVPPLEFAPNVIHDSNLNKMEDVLADVKDFNIMLSQLAQTLRSKHSNITVFEFDLHDLFNRIYQNPLAFPQTMGYKNKFVECPEYVHHLKPAQRPNATQISLCGGLQPEQILWLDGLHISSAMHDGLAAGMGVYLMSNGTQHL